MESRQRGMRARLSETDGVAEQPHPVRMPEKRHGIIGQPRSLDEVAFAEYAHPVRDVPRVLGILPEDREDGADGCEIAVRSLLDLLDTQERMGHRRLLPVQER